MAAFCLPYDCQRTIQSHVIPADSDDIHSGGQTVCFNIETVADTCCERPVVSRCDESSQGVKDVNANVG